ncbi:complement C1q tumor necrosis factor-related protein 4-like [Ruditapes philippinarum]|uniref:complement C1q tumor necrosis factor-related protein 4-like n=1 Tax=Ruditapes philippinarum TaxID=129788 RepID=UPI00295BACC3|nr:complement C1q tumor necrosis factor-related protein 4-like [Ruditapes philippinarum]
MFTSNMCVIVIIASTIIGMVTSQGQAVAFSAGVSRDQTLLHAETIVYDKIFTNIGAAYNSSSGVFTCQTPGYYVFQFHTLARQDKSAWLELYKNTDYISTIFGHSSNDYGSAGNTAILLLATGDQVYVKAVDSSFGVNTDLYGQPDEVYTIFSGYLVHAVCKMIALFVACVTLGLVAGQGEVAFSAGLTHDQNILHAENVVFDKVFTNIGNGYDATTGIFTCPMAGTYTFQFHTLAHQDKSSWLNLYKNKVYIASIYGHTVNDFAGGSNSVVLPLASGDTVEIRAVDGSYGTDTNLYGQPDEIYTTFSGYRISS